MRPLRFLLTLTSCIVAFFLLLYIGPWRSTAHEDVEEQGSIGAYFNWRTPSSLFPPSAIISLTDDNSTFFLARPAAFGPVLPAKSLSGQLWIGSGFGAERLGHGGTSAEGELGCSDVPGWNDGNYASSGKSLNDAKASWAGPRDSSSSRQRKRDVSHDEQDNGDSTQHPVENDGTDDHLHHPLPASDGLKSNGRSAGTTKKPTHADIQSLQESAEIAGKVVMLSRGGCGFLEKVKWVQRRGGVALIVGDDIRGGPLVTMYARGDTSNVTIPSLFTSHTTAHLLSSLVPSGGALEGISPEEAERLGLALGDKSDSASTAEQKGHGEKPNFTTSSATMKSTPSTKVATNEYSGQEYTEDERQSGWFGSFFGRRNGNGNGEDQRPPSSGNIGWRLQEEFEDDQNLEHVKAGQQSKPVPTPSTTPSKLPDHGSSDGFVIGVQDWRDPDLVAQQKEQLSASSSSTSSATAQNSKAAYSGGPRGGSITPGSGEYANNDHHPVDPFHPRESSQVDSSYPKEAAIDRNSGNWFGRFFSSQDRQGMSEASSKKSENKKSGSTSQATGSQSEGDAKDPEIHEGLWVTLTPTSMSSSPFFDTLLVLVVSPLVTLTVVYALLLLRSRIRRRRWRAPKSVVERLPVRTYQTMPSTTATSSTTSAISSPISASTPLLPSSARPITGRPRPRSRTASEVPVQQSSSLSSMAPPSLEQIEEKRTAGLSEWRKRYGGKQRECVVCLEEYVDGVSRVMSLPCGHEFHADCM